MEICISEACAFQNARSGPFSQIQSVLDSNVQLTGWVHTPVAWFPDLKGKAWKQDRWLSIWCIPWWEWRKLVLQDHGQTVSQYCPPHCGERNGGTRCSSLSQYILDLKAIKII